MTRACGLSIPPVIYKCKAYQKVRANVLFTRCQLDINSTGMDITYAYMAKKAPLQSMSV